MAREWYELTNLTRGEAMLVERIRLANSDVSIEGSFELPLLAQLSAEDQIFVMAFIRYNGSIKEMERVFGISYPTVKNRLRNIAERLKFTLDPPEPVEEEILTQLENGEITTAEAIERLSK